MMKQKRKHLRIDNPNDHPSQQEEDESNKVYNLESNKKRIISTN